MKVSNKDNPGSYFVLCPSAEVIDNQILLYPSNWFDWIGQERWALISFLRTSYVFYKADKYHREFKRRFNGRSIRQCDAYGLEGWTGVQFFCRQMDKECRKHGAQFASVMLTGNYYLPMLDIDKSWPCETADIAFDKINALEYRNLGRWDLHPNAAAQKKWLEKLEPWLKNKLAEQQT